MQVISSRSKVNGLIAKLRQLATVDSAAYVSSKGLAGFYHGVRSFGSDTWLDLRADTGRNLGAKLNHCFVNSTQTSYYKSTGNKAIVEPERKW